MKRLLIILLLLCPLINGGILHAQLYSTSSSRYHSYTTGGTAIAPEPYQFHSTSSYRATITQNQTSSTAPFVVANGTIKTIASSVKGGVLLGNANNSSEGYIPTTQNGTPVIPGVPDTPIGDGWDVAVFLLLLCAAYAIYLKRKIENEKVKG